MPLGAKMVPQPTCGLNIKFVPLENFHPNLLSRFYEIELQTSRHKLSQYNISTIYTKLAILKVHISKILLFLNTLMSPFPIYLSIILVFIYLCLFLQMSSNRFSLGYQISSNSLNIRISNKL